MIKFELTLPYSQELYDQVNTFIENNEICTVQDDIELKDENLILTLVPQWNDQVIEFTTLVRELAEFLIELGYEL